MPPLSTRALLRFTPGSYLGLEVVPILRLTDELSLTGHARYFEKRRDTYELLDPALPLDPSVLSVESGVKLTQVGGGLRYSTVEPWAAGEAPRPLELHIRVVHSMRGGGGHTPVSTRAEAGIRLFRRIWGPEPGR